MFYNSLSPAFKYLVKNTFNKSTYIIVEGEVTKRQFAILKDYEHKVRIITNGLPERKLKITLDGKVYKQDETFNLIYLSYMIESKGYWDVLEAVNILVNKLGKDVKCIFAGMFKTSVDDEKFKNEKEAETAFHNFIAENNLNEKITYYRGLMGEEKADAFIKSHVFLLPSYFKFEGQPVSVLEAMAYGSVPIVTNYRMIPEMVTDESGVLVDRKSPIRISERISFLMDNPEDLKRYSQAAVDRFQEKFHTGKIL